VVIKWIKALEDSHWITRVSYTT